MLMYVPEFLKTFSRVLAQEHNVLDAITDRSAPVVFGETRVSILSRHKKAQTERLKHNFQHFRNMLRASVLLTGWAMKH